MLNQTVGQIQTPALSIHSYMFQYKNRVTPILIVSILYFLDAIQLLVSEAVDSEVLRAYQIF